MKKIALVFALCLFACSDSSKIDEEKFYDMYKEILLIRKDNEDTAVANPLVRELYQKYDYKQEQFKYDFSELSKDGKTFTRKIDSIRNVVTNFEKNP